MARHKRRAIVCGTNFGRYYLKAFADPETPFELFGILGRGSNRTRACAERYGVPVFTELDQIPKDVDVACVVVGAGVNGGEGAKLAQELMHRGVHVLQEHPLLPTELADCLRTAHQTGVQYHLNTHYVSVEPVRHFIMAARRLAAESRLLFVDAACSIQVAYTLFDILGHALTSLRPWGFAAPPVWPHSLRDMTGGITPPYRSLEGVLNGLPFTLRIQNELDPEEPDNYSHFLHRVIIGSEGGCLTLVDTHGPIAWTPRLHLPTSAARLTMIHEAPETYLDYPAITNTALGYSPTYRDILEKVWPGGVVIALQGLANAIDQKDQTLKRGQYYLAVCELWQHVTRLLGFPTLRTGSFTVPLPPSAILGDLDVG